MSDISDFHLLLCRFHQSIFIFELSEYCTTIYCELSKTYGRKLTNCVKLKCFGNFLIFFVQVKLEYFNFYGHCQMDYLTFVLFDKTCASQVKKERNNVLA
jgi:hypothetical protein